MTDVDDACFAAFGLTQDNVLVQFTPQDGSGTQQIDGIVVKPALEEASQPGSSKGTKVMRLFVRFIEITPNPRVGDVITVNGVDYAVNDIDVDRAGGSVLKLRSL